MEANEDEKFIEFKRRDRERSLVILWTFAALILLDAVISFVAAMTFGALVGVGIFLVALVVVYFAMRKSLLSIAMLKGPWPR